MGTHANTLRVTLTTVNSPILYELGSLIPVGSTTIGKLLEAAGKSGSLAAHGKGMLADGALHFISGNISAFLVGRVILKIPFNQITAMHINKSYFGSSYFTLVHGGTTTDIVADYGGRAFRDQLAAEVRAAGGIVISFEKPTGQALKLRLPWVRRGLLHVRRWFRLSAWPIWRSSGDTAERISRLMLLGAGDI